MNPTADMLQVVWPLSFVLVFLFVLRKVGGDISPIVTSMMTGLAAGAQRNATQWGIAFLFGLSASLAAFYDVFNELDAKGFSLLGWHQYAALWAKCLNPFIVAVLAYVTQSSFKPGNGSSGGGTNPPFPKPQPPAP